MDLNVIQPSSFPWLMPDPEKFAGLSRTGEGDVSFEEKGFDWILLVREIVDRRATFIAQHSFLTRDFARHIWTAIFIVQFTEVIRQSEVPWAKRESEPVVHPLLHKIDPTLIPVTNIGSQIERAMRRERSGHPSGRFSSAGESHVAHRKCDVTDKGASLAQVEREWNNLLQLLAISRKVKKGKIDPVGEE